MNAVEKSLRAAAKADPQGAGAVFADWLEDAGRSLEAAQWRQRAGLSEVRYAVVPRGQSPAREHQKSTRLYSTLSNARGAITEKVFLNTRRHHGETVTEAMRDEEYQKWEIQVFEYRMTMLGVLPSRKQDE
jgi:sirohydrochlorin ferrochelatase